MSYITKLPMGVIPQVNIWYNPRVHKIWVIDTRYPIKPDYVLLAGPFNRSQDYTGKWTVSGDVAKLKKKFAIQYKCDKHNRGMHNRGTHNRGKHGGSVIHYVGEVDYVGGDGKIHYAKRPRVKRAKAKFIEDTK